MRTAAANRAPIRSQVRDRLRTLLLDAIARERDGQLIDRSLMRHTLSMLADLGVDGFSVYEDDFERQFLEATRAFYQRESRECLANNPCPDYMRKAEVGCRRSSLLLLLFAQLLRRSFGEAAAAARGPSSDREAEAAAARIRGPIDS